VEMDSHIPVGKGRNFQGRHKKIGGIIVVLTYNRNSLFLGIKAAGICNTKRKSPMTLKETHVYETCLR
jgi:hypothetical protein